MNSCVGVLAKLGRELVETAVEKLLVGHLKNGGVAIGHTWKRIRRGGVEIQWHSSNQC